MKQVVMSKWRMLLSSQQSRIYVLFVQEFAGCPEDHGDMGLLFRCNYKGKPKWPEILEFNACQKTPLAKHTRYAATIRLTAVALTRGRGIIIPHKRSIMCT